MRDKKGRQGKKRAGDDTGGGKGVVKGVRGGVVHGKRKGRGGAEKKAKVQLLGPAVSISRG